MKKSISKNLTKRKQKISKRLKKRNWENQPLPMLKTTNIHYEMDGRHQGLAPGGIGLIHLLYQRIGLNKEIDNRIELLKKHAPYHESDHVANIAYNILAGGHCLQDIEQLRNNEAWLNGLGASVIPDPTTSGDFLRRFDEQSIVDLMDAKNAIRKRIWEKQSGHFKREAVVNLDGTIDETTGECKQGMDISYNGKWGYAPLIISLAKTREPLYIINRSGNSPSHLGSATWLDKTLDLLEGTFKKITIRGDTDFSLTANFDRWDQRCTFLFGMDARKNLVALAEGVPEFAWQLFEKPGTDTAQGKSRKRPKNIKDQVVYDREFKKLTTECEHVAEFEYKPGKCTKPYRMIVLRKTIQVVKGQLHLFDDTRYFFYITNDWERCAPEIVQFYRKRADHENDIEQLKNGVKAIQSPSDSLLSNWAYMVIAALAWDLKAWYGLLMPNKALGLAIIRMEFKQFIQTFIQIPCLIIRAGRKITYRIVGYNESLRDVFRFFDVMKAFRFT